MKSHAVALLMLALAIPPGQEEKKKRLDKNLELGIPPDCSVSGKEILGAIDDGAVPSIYSSARPELDSYPVCRHHVGMDGRRLRYRELIVDNGLLSGVWS